MYTPPLKYRRTDQPTRHNGDKILPTNDASILVGHVISVAEHGQRGGHNASRGTDVAGIRAIAAGNHVFLRRLVEVGLVRRPAVAEEPVGEGSLEKMYLLAVGIMQASWSTRRTCFACSRVGPFSLKV